MRFAERGPRDDDTGFERRLWQAARAEQPSSASRTRVSAGLVLGARAGVATAENLTPGGVSGTSNGVTLPSRASPLAVLGKYTLIGLVGLSGNGTSGPGVQPPSPDSAPRSATAAPALGVDAKQPEALPLEALSLEAPSRGTPPPDAVPLRGAPVEKVARQPGASQRRAASRAHARTPSLARGEDGLMAEVKALDLARTALDHGQAARALAHLDEHATRFPAAQLALEAAVLRVGALDLAGRFAEATALARRTLRAPGGERYLGELEPIADRQHSSGSSPPPRDIEESR